MVLNELKKRFPDMIENIHVAGDLDVAIVKAGAITEVLAFLKEDPELSFEFLMDLTAVDYPGREPRFELVYHLFSLSNKRRLRVKAGVYEPDPAIESVTGLYKSALWFEREVWDMFGISFSGHPDLRRILMYEGFKGHPLRKDYKKDERQPTVPSLDFPDPSKDVRRVIKASDLYGEGKRGGRGKEKANGGE